jgi:hypothetical protein
VTDEEFPLLARVKAVHNGSKTEPKGMTLDFEPIDAEVRKAFHAFVEQGVGSSAALKLAGAVSNGKEIRPLFAPDAQLVKGSETDAADEPAHEVDEMMLVTEEELSSDRMIDLLSDLAIEAPAAAPPVVPSEAPPAPVPVPDGNAEAWEELRNSLLAAPEDVSLLFRLGSGLARQKATAFEAVGFLQRLLALEPHHPLANGALALAYAQIGQRAAAERHLSRARRMGQPVDARIRALLAASSAGA